MVHSTLNQFCPQAMHEISFIQGILRCAYKTKTNINHSKTLVQHSSVDVKSNYQCHSYVIIANHLHKMHTHCI